MAGAKCLPGDRRIGGRIEEFTGIEAFNFVKVPRNGYFCVTGNVMSVNIESFPRTPRFIVELVQRNSKGKDIVINSTIFDPEGEHSVLTVLFSENGTDIANTRCFLRLIPNGSLDDQLSMNIKVRSFG